MRVKIYFLSILLFNNKAFAAEFDPSLDQYDFFKEDFKITEVKPSFDCQLAYIEPLISPLIGGVNDRELLDNQIEKTYVSEDVYDYPIEVPSGGRWREFPFKIFLRSTQRLERLREKESGKLFAYAALRAVSELSLNPEKQSVSVDTVFGSITTGVSYGYVTGHAWLLKDKTICIATISSPKFSNINLFPAFNRF